MKGRLDLEVTGVLEASDLALVTGVWSFNGTGPDGEPVKLAAKSADVLRRQGDGSWRFVIDNPWGTDDVRALGKVRHGRPRTTAFAEQSSTLGSAPDARAPRPALALAWLVVALLYQYRESGGGRLMSFARHA